MTPKEKAIELIDKYRTYIRKADVYDYLFFEDENFLSKQCALIAVTEIINSNPHSNPFNTDVHSTMKYWIEVKNEISNL
jgi:hypothetical protein